MSPAVAAGKAENCRAIYRSVESAERVMEAPRDHPAACFGWRLVGADALGGLRRTSLGHERIPANLRRSLSPMRSKPTLLR